MEVRHAQPGVGANLQDHLQIRTVFRVGNTVTRNEVANSLRAKLRIATESALRRSGPMSMAPSQFGMFTRSAPSLDTPDLECHVQPLATHKLGDPLHDFPAITVSVRNLRPESVGSSHTISAGADRQPVIRLNYLSAEADRRIALASIRQARQIMKARALAPYAPQEILPGPAAESDQDLLEAAGNIATTIFHPAGTCRMGSDAAAVVDPTLRVTELPRLQWLEAP